MSRTPASPPTPPQLRLLALLAALGLLAVVITRVMYAQIDTVAPKAHIFEDADDTRPAPPPSRPPLRVLVASMVSAGWTLDLYEQLAERLGAAVGRRGVLVQRRNYAEANDAIQHGDVDLAFVCSGAYVDGERNGVSARLLAVPVVRGKKTYRSYLLVSASSAIHKFADLRGKRAIYVDPTSLTGGTWMRSEIVRHGDRDGHFFGRITYSGSHDRSVETVARGLADVAPVDGLIFEMMAQARPELLRQVRVLERSPPFAAPPVVMPRRRPAGLRAALLHALTTMHLDPAGKKVLAGLHIDRFVVTNAAAYASVRKVWDGLSP